MWTSQPWRSWFRLGAWIFRGRSARSSHWKTFSWASRSWSVRKATRSASWSSPDARRSQIATHKPRTRHAPEKRRRSLCFGVEKGADAVQDQLRALVDYPVADAVDQLNLEIADAVRISVGQIRRNHRIVGASQPTNRYIYANVTELAAHPCQHLPVLEGCTSGHRPRAASNRHRAMTETTVETGLW